MEGREGRVDNREGTGSQDRAGAPTGRGGGEVGVGEAAGAAPDSYTHTRQDTNAYLYSPARATTHAGDQR